MDSNDLSAERVEGRRAAGAEVDLIGYKKLKKNEADKVSQRFANSLFIVSKTVSSMESKSNQQKETVTLIAGIDNQTRVRNKFTEFTSPRKRLLSVASIRLLPHMRNAHCKSICDLSSLRANGEDKECKSTDHYKILFKHLESREHSSRFHV